MLGLSYASAFGRQQFMMSVRLHEYVQAGAFALHPCRTNQIRVGHVHVSACESRITVHLGIESLQADVQA